MSVREPSKEDAAAPGNAPPLESPDPTAWRISANQLTKAWPGPFIRINLILAGVSLVTCGAAAFYFALTRFLDTDYESLGAFLFLCILGAAAVFLGCALCLALVGQGRAVHGDTRESQRLDQLVIGRLSEPTKRAWLAFSALAGGALSLWYAGLVVLTLIADPDEIGRDIQKYDGEGILGLVLLAWIGVSLLVFGVNSLWRTFHTAR